MAASSESRRPPGLDGPGRHPRRGLRHLRDLLETRTASGAILTSIEVPTMKYGPHPGAGMYKDDPLFDRWREAIEAYRQEVEDDPNR